MGTYTKNLKLETPNYTDNADIPALTKKNNEIIDSEMIKRANGLDYNEQTGVLQLTGNNSKVGSPIQIKNNLPVTSMASGTELKVNNYKQLIKFTKEGKTEQKTSKQSKNLIGLKKGFTQTVNGMTVSVQEDGGLRVTGTPTKISESYIPLEGVSSISNGDYTLSVKTIGSTPSNACRLLKTNLASAANSFKSTALSCQSNTTKSMSATITDEEVYTYFYFYTNANVTIDATIYPQLEKGSTYTEWVEFTPDSPSPDYPQLINNVKGIENIWFGGESTTVNGVTFTKNDDGSYDITGTATASADCINLVNIANAKLKNGINYNLSINKLTNEKVSILTEAYIENWDSHVIGPLITSTTLSTNKIINIKDNITRVRYVIRVEKGQTVNIKGLKIQLEEGSIAHNFVPNGSNYLQLKNVSKNLFNYTPVLITQVKSNLRTKNIYLDSNILLKKGTYILSFPDMVMKNNIKEFGVQLFDNNTQLATLTLSNNKKSAIFTINNDANINRLYTYLDNSDNNDATITYKNIQIEEGSESTSYEPYKEKIINVDLKGNNLCSDRDKTIRDELVIENGKAKINKIIKEFTFTGNEEFTKRSDGDGSTTITFNLPIHEDIVELNTVSNMFSYEQSSTSGNEGIGVSIGNNKLVYIQIKRSRLSSLDVAGFKEFLKAKYNAGTPLKIQCELIEPEVIDLGKVDFDLIENSTLTCEEESDMQIDYLTISSNIFVQDNLDGNSNQKAPSVDAVNKAINKISNYSSEEQCIGEWFGEKHYRKVFEIDMDSTLKQMTIPTGIDMKQLTHAYGVALNSDTIYLPLNFYNNLGWDSFHLVGKGANIILQRGDNFSITKVFITLEYTKNV